MSSTDASDSVLAHLLGYWQFKSMVLHTARVPGFHPNAYKLACLMYRSRGFPILFPYACFPTPVSLFL